MSIDLGPHIKVSIDDLIHRAKMAYKATKTEEAAENFEKASDLMFKYAEYAATRDLEYQRKKKAIEYRDYARRLRDSMESDKRVADVRKRAASNREKFPSPLSSGPSAQTETTERGAELSSAVAAMVKTSPVTWSDIGGLDETKEDIKYTLGLSLAQPPEGIKLHTFRNILFYGPPGTGKTILAAATSNALKSGVEEATSAMFFNVKVSGVMSKYFGESSKIISEIYGSARDNSPSVVFLDEFESISGKRGNEDQSGAEKRILSTILSELDGLSEKGRSDLFVLTIAATNRPWDIDEAVLSRFEKRILIPLPDRDTRGAILDILFLKRGFATDADLNDIVDISEGFSGREVERLCKEVTTRMIRDMNRDLPSIVDSGLSKAKTYEVKIRPVTMDEWHEAAKRVTPGTSKEEMDLYLRWNDQAET